MQTRSTGLIECCLGLLLLGVSGCGGSEPNPQAELGIAKQQAAKQGAEGNLDDNSTDGEMITVELRVKRYTPDAVHNTMVGPGGVTYHADMYDAAFCQPIGAAGSDQLPNPLVIWGWNRTVYVPKPLQEANATVKVRLKRSDISTTPLGDDSQGVAAEEIQILE